MYKYWDLQPPSSYAPSDWLRSPTPSPFQNINIHSRSARKVHSLPLPTPPPSVLYTPLLDTSSSQFPRATRSPDMARTRPQSRPRSRSTSTSTCPSTQPTRSRSHSARYAHLAPTTLHISRTKILKTWTPLPLPTQDRIRRALLDVRDESKARGRRRALPKPKNGITKKDKHAAGAKTGVLVEKNEEWEGAVNDIVEKLIARLPRMPFPPQHSRVSAKSSASAHVGSVPARNGAGSAELDLDLERILSRTSALRATLSSNNQGVKLLRAQIKREERALKRDTGGLKGLEEGVRRGRDVAARQRRDLHPVARGMGGPDEESDGAGGGKMATGRVDEDEYTMMMEGLIPTAARTRRTRAHVALLTNEAIAKDEELAPLVKQLRSHLESMQSNVAGMKDLRRTMDGAAAMLMRWNVKALGA